MKNIKRKTKYGYTYVFYTFFALYNILRGPDNYSLINEYLTPYFYYGALVSLASFGLIYSIFWFSKPYGKVWTERLVIYKSPFNTYDIDVLALRSYHQEGEFKILLKDSSNKSYILNTKFLADKSKVVVLQNYLKNKVSKNNN